MSKKTIYFCITIICFVFISNCFAGSDLPYKEGELLVQFSQKADGSQRTTAERDNILAAVQGATVKKTSKFVPALTLVKLPANQTVENALEIFSKTGGILHAQPNYLYKALSTTPNDPCFVAGKLWGMHNTGQNGGTPDADIDAPEAWDIIHDACDIIVAVIDSGVDYTHPDLAANMWTDANGLHGYDFVNDDNDPMDDNYHGTHVAGIIGARGNNSVGVTGVCWNVKIMAVKFLDYTGAGYTADAIDCIYYAVNHGAKILNNSWGGTPETPQLDQQLKNAIEAADANGVLFIAAAGNADEYYNPIDNDSSYTYPTYPASYDCNNIISVMATNNTDQPTYYSSYGYTRVDLAAPGGEQFYEGNPGDPGGILSTIPGNAYRFYQGTSMAAPHVAGACALVWATHPNLTHLQVKDTIMQSVDHLTSLSGLCVAGGRLNLFNAVHAVTGSPIYLTQTDDANAKGVKPADRFTYTIDYNDSNGAITLTNVVLTDYLPAEVLHTNVVPDHNGVYDSNTHTVTWTLGTLTHGSSGFVTVTVTVGNTRPSMGYLGNTTKITAAEANETTITRWTRWYYRVHNETKGFWRDTIQSAINDANTTTNDVIVVYPGIYMEYINFGSKKVTLQSTDPNDPSIVAQTVIRANGGEAAVTFTDNNSVINGFAVKNIISVYGGTGVFCSGSASAPTIKNCLIRDNSIGVFCHNSSAPTIKNCTVTNNFASGLNCTSTKQVKIINNWIVNNGSRCDGIYINSAAADVIIRNNTISNNPSSAIYRSGGIDPNITNCIIWNNGANFGGTPCNDVNYCCISGTSVYPGNGNIKTDPCFVDVNAGNYHIKAASLCRNNGDPNTTLVDINETDIDGENRINGTGRVDIGADEYYSSSDLNGDWQVNFLDYAIFANAWKTHQGYSKWNPACDFIDDNDINCLDLAWFAQDWYFPPADQQGQMFGMGEEELPLPPIYLAYDGSMTPDPNTEVTVYIHSDIPLSNMDMLVAVTGDANITTAMNSYDCNQYGWDSEWGWEPYIDPSGWVEFGGVSEAGQATGTVGYFKFIYNSGEVTVSITADSYVYDANSQPAAFSTDPLIFGGEGMQGGQQQSMMQNSLFEECPAMDSTEVDVNELADWLEQIWFEDAELRTTTTPEEWQQFIDNLRSGQFQ